MIAIAVVIFVLVLIAFVEETPRRFEDDDL